MFGLPSVSDSGVLMTYGYAISALFKRAAPLIDRILRGAKPADIPVEQINVYELPRPAPDPARAAATVARPRQRGAVVPLI